MTRGRPSRRSCRRRTWRSAHRRQALPAPVPLQPAAGAVHTLVVDDRTVATALIAPLPNGDDGGGLVVLFLAVSIVAHRLPAGWSRSPSTLSPASYIARVSTVAGSVPSAMNSPVL